MRTKQEIEDFLKGLSTEVDILKYIDIDDIDQKRPFGTIYGMLLANGGFDVEVTDRDEAIRYLSQHDPTLTKSKSLIEFYDYDKSEVNPELMAGLLQSERLKDRFAEFEDKINSFFKDCPK
jgi:hypothetical protein